MPPKPQEDLISRGQYSASPAGTATFIGLRILDIFIQTSILTDGASVLARWNIPTLPSPVSSNLSPPIALGLGLKPLVLIALAAGSTLKQVFWLSVTAQETMPVDAAVKISAFNTVSNSLNSLASLWAGLGLASALGAASRTRDELSMIDKVGVALYAIGIAIETVSEIQRWSFKKDPRNKGKVYSGGLFSLARHVNYGGFVLWRGSYALVAGGPVWAAIITAFITFSFVRNSIPSLDSYCEQRYGAQWTEYKKNTTWKLIPGIY